MNPILLIAAAVIFASAPVVSGAAHTVLCIALAIASTFEVALLARDVVLGVRHYREARIFQKAHADFIGSLKRAQEEREGDIRKQDMRAGADLS